jgi:hypothetical protein
MQWCIQPRETPFCCSCCCCRRRVVTRCLSRSMSSTAPASQLTALPSSWSGWQQVRARAGVGREGGSLQFPGGGGASRRGACAGLLQHLTAVSQQWQSPVANAKCHTLHSLMIHQHRSHHLSCCCVLSPPPPPPVLAGERAAAEQPPGLTVQLHPYQLQSLAFMQEAERWEGGWRHLLWKWLPPTTQQQQQQQQARPSSSSSSAAAAGGAVSAQPGVGPGVWWSPVLGRVASEVPAAPWGGFLAEEMVSAWERLAGVRRGGGASWQTTW